MYASYGQYYFIIHHLFSFVHTCEDAEEGIAVERSKAFQCWSDKIKEKLCQG